MTNPLKEVIDSGINKNETLMVELRTNNSEMEQLMISKIDLDRERIELYRSNQQLKSRIKQMKTKIYDF